MEKNISYFKNLDALRAIAAIIVVIGHVELLKECAGIENIFGRIPSGHTSVILFFVLSGFLITYLLTKELIGTGTISIRNFYTKRFFRIMPVYYLVLLVSLIFCETAPSLASWLLNGTIFPNVAKAIGDGWHTSPQIWSIGVEQQFYLFVPFVLVFFHKRNCFISFATLFAIGWTIMPHAIYFVNHHFVHIDIAPCGKFFLMTKFNSLAIGSICGYALAVDSKIARALCNKPLFYLTLLITIASWGMNLEYSYFTDELNSLLFAILIVNFAANQNLKFSIDCKPMNFLGRISYGIYMYHWIAILLIMSILPPPHFDCPVLYNIVLYVLVLGISLGIATLSFYTYEKYFMELRKRFQK